MIQSISYTNMKGSTGAHDLAPLSVITGTNFAGKTTVLQALILAFNGFLPELGKTNPATFDLASGTELKVSAVIDGITVARIWKQAGKTIKGTKPDGDVPALSILSGHEFTSASPAARLTLLAELAGGTGGMDDLWKECQRTMKVCGIFENEAVGETVLAKTDCVLTLVAELAKASKTRKDQFDATLSGLAELGAASAATPPPDTLTPMDAARRELHAAEAEERAAENKAQDAIDAVDELESFLDANPESNVEPVQPEMMQDVTRELRDTAASIAYAENMLSAEVPPVAGYDPERHDQLEQEAEHGDWERKLTEAGAAIGILGNANGNHARAIQVLEKEAAEMEALECCPTCAAAGTGWKTKVLNRIAKSIQEEQIVMSKDAESLAKLQDDYAKIQKNVTTLRTELPQLRQLKHAEETRRNHLSQLKPLEESLPALREKLAGLHDQDNHQAEARRTFLDRMAKHGEWRRLQHAVTVAGGGGALAAARERSEAALKAVAELTAAHDAAEPARIAWGDHQSRQAEIGRAKKAADDEAENHKKLTAAGKALKDVREKEIRKMFDPVIAAAAAFSDGVLPTPLTLHPTSGQIGRWSPQSVFIPFGAMSGTEQHVAIGALQIALSAAGRGIVVLDEMSMMHVPVKARFLDRLAKLHSDGVIHQAILIDHSVEIYSADWKRIVV